MRPDIEGSRLMIIVNPLTAGYTFGVSSRWALRRRCLHLALLACCAFNPLLPQLPAQTAESQAAVPVLKLNARQVLVDVVVTGKHGKPATGLHKEDFQVFEDGSARPVSSFEEHGSTPSPEEASLPLGSAEPNVFTNLPQVTANGSLLILLLDSLNTPEADQSRVRGAMLKYLRHVTPGRPIAIFTLGTELRCIQGFTGDASVLRALAEDRRGGLPVAGSPLLASKQQGVTDKNTLAMISDAGHGSGSDGFGNLADHVASFQNAEGTLLESDRKLTTLEAFLDLAHYLSGIPGRKSVAWFSGSFPHLMWNASEALEPFKAQRDYPEKAKATEDALAAARVAIYPISAGGLDTGSFYDTDTQLTSHKPMDAQQEARDSLAADGKVRNESQASMDSLAQATGGQAIYNTNDLNSALERVADDGSHYYTLFFTPGSTASATEYRKIDVKVAGGHYKLAYNHGYYAKETVAAVPAAAKPGDDPLRPYLRPGAMDSTQLPLDLRVTVVAASDQKKALQGNRGSGVGCSSENQTVVQPVTCYAVRFSVGARRLQFQDAADGSHQDALLLELLVADKNGKMLNGITSKVNLKLDDARYNYILAHGSHLELRIGVPKDGVSLRGGVYDRNSGYAGTLQVALARVVSEPAASVMTEAATPASSPAASASSAVLTTEAASNKQIAPHDALAEAATINAAEDAVTVPLPTVENSPAVAEKIPEMKSASATFWTLSPDEVGRMLALAPGEGTARYTRLRNYFTKYGCTGNHVSPALTPSQPEGNLVCMLPGNDTRTIVVTAHFDRRPTDAGDTENWSSATMLVRLYKALQAQQRHFSYVFVALHDETGEKQFLQSLASADLRSLVAVVALDLRTPGTLHYQVSQAEQQGISGIATEDQVLRSRAIRQGEATKATLASTLAKAAQVNKLPQPVQLEAARAVLNTQMFRRETYIPSILIYSQASAHENMGQQAPDGLFNLLATFLCGLDVNLASR